jgi:hypothetical protein
MSGAVSVEPFAADPPFVTSSTNDDVATFRNVWIVAIHPVFVVVTDTVPDSLPDDRVSRVRMYTRRPP